MDRDEIIRMAREAGFEVHDRKQQARVGMEAMLGIDSTDKLQRFAALVAAAEREACESECSGQYYRFIGPAYGEVRYGIAACATAIRARGQA